MRRPLPPASCLQPFLTALLLLIAAPAFAEDSPKSDLLAADGIDGDDLDGGFGWAGPWVTSKISPGIVVDRGLGWPDGGVSLSDGRAVEILGTDDRNNPLRRQLAEPCDANELYVRFLLRYAADGIDRAADDDGEFFVIWFDDVDGGDGATHGDVPNVGIHVATDGPLEGDNVFMVRISPQETAFSEVALEGDRTRLIVARLAKSVPGSFENFDTLQLWVDPQADAKKTPAASMQRRRSISLVEWIGVSTGRKTEPGDRILLDEFAVGRTWESVLGLPPVPVPEETVMPPEPVVLVSFRDEVHPLLVARCLECHWGSDPDSGTRLDHLDAILDYVVPGNADGSPLMQRVVATDSDERMPPVDAGPALTEDERALLQTWINQGASWDDELLPTPPVESDHWAFQPVERPPVPASEPEDDMRTPVDAFLLAASRDAGIVPVDAADLRTLIRRLSFDLTGLPPTPSEVSSFVDDDRPDAYERLVERLLASPHHGERWGRHWLDLARFAESNGHQHNRDRPHAWRYRDYVVDSFNAGETYEQFLAEQIAGDELEPFRDENVIATGFLAAARYSGNELDKTRQRNDILVDVVNTTGSAILGLTLECAQCHNHKFDPISARDYYRFQGFFLQAQPVNVVLPDATEELAAQSESDELARLVQEQQEIFNSVHERMIRAERKRRPEGDILITPSNVVKGMTAEERERYNELNKQIESLPQTWAFHSPVTASRSLHVPKLELRWPLEFDPQQLATLQPTLYVRGDIASPGPVVGTGWPAVLGPPPDDHDNINQPRKVLADWLTSRDNPLTARVWVNRIWQYHFGRGLVADASNFGVETPLPRHAALLDWLAVELIDSGWDTRHIQRLILLSSAYRRSSQHSTVNASIDPENELFWKWVPRRLEAEAIRDAILAVAGTLDDALGGPSDDAADSTRRSLYQFQRRDQQTRMQELFDGPSTLTSCSRRDVSTVPLQPLYLLNNDFIRDQGIAFTERVRGLAGDDQITQIETAFVLALGRRPDATELEQSVEFFAESADAESPDAALVDFCQALLNLNEFLYLP